MPKLSANLTWLFTDVPFEDRFAAAARAGFKYVEFSTPYEYPAEMVKELLDRNDLKVVLFNLPAGNEQAGDRGIGAIPNRVDEFRAGVEIAVSYAKILGVPRVNCLAGKMVPAHSREEHRRTLIENLRFAADALAKIGVNLLVEHVNQFRAPGFFIHRIQEARAAITQADRPNIYVLYDIYHAQRTEGNLAQILHEHIDRIGHIHVADTPGRHQPGTGEINYRFLFSEIDRLGYRQFVGLEYEPIPDTLSSLAWIKQYGCDLV